MKSYKQQLSDAKSKQNGATPEIPAQIWIAACGHQLQQTWRTVDPVLLEGVAGELWQDASLRALVPGEATRVWLEPIGGGIGLPVALRC